MFIDFQLVIKTEWHFFEMARDSSSVLSFEKSKFTNQFKQYLQSLSTAGNDISKLKYVFNGKKVSEKGVKEAFVKLFNRKAEEIYSANESVFNALEIDKIELANITSSHIIFTKFIQI
ncbi:hypothetical protein P1X15_17405 [Runella sp. MFBS21]|uniref:hypothetical protein n=1 Tax=Runella sp. MFBS21 TaxID=3034018 RepID=UPI0023F72EAA|nr:hypothetical protein [Runella sp. MFBS21]MDF7819399.1 hypothetical protein [Runella sp. MFBS21]